MTSRSSPNIHSCDVHHMANLDAALTPSTPSSEVPKLDGTNSAQRNWRLGRAADRAFRNPGLDWVRMAMVCHGHERFEYVGARLHRPLGRLLFGEVAQEIKKITTAT